MGMRVVTARVWLCWTLWLLLTTASPALTWTDTTSSDGGVEGGRSHHEYETIHIVWVSCGHERVQEVLTSIRSVLLFTTNPSRMFFHIIVNEESAEMMLQHTLASWQSTITAAPTQSASRRMRTSTLFSFQLYQAQMPAAYENLFAPCACQRLFLHQILPMSRVLYLDTDTLLLSDVADLWTTFETHGPHVLAAAAPEHEATHQHAHYKDEASHPYVQAHGIHGINSGVLLLHLDRIVGLSLDNDDNESNKSKAWTEELEDDRLNYQEHLRFYDQDLLNIYFAKHPDRLALLPCGWNYRPDHCYYRKHCEPSSLHLLHGNRGVFHKPPTDQSFAPASFSFFYTAVAKATEVGDCAPVLKGLEQQVEPWLAQKLKVTNNCEATIFPIIRDRLLTLCHYQLVEHEEL